MHTPLNSITVFTRSLLRRDPSYTVLVLPVVAMLSACGGGSSGGGGGNAVSAPPVALAAQVDVAQGDSSPLADVVDTQTLQQMAAKNVAQGITVNLTGAQRLNEGGSSVLAGRSGSSSELFLDATSIFSASSSSQLFNDVTDQGMGLVDTTALSALGGLIDETTSLQAAALVEATLGLDESNGAQVQRAGNTITIDPDDAALCEALQSDEVPTVMQVTTCQQLVSNLTVQLNAVTEQRGEIAYLYNSQPLLSVAYGPLNAAYTLNLGTLHQAEQYSDQLSGITPVADATQQVQGSLRLQSRVANNSEGQEAGNLRVEMLDKLQISYLDGSSFSMAPSLLMSLDHDDALGTASVVMELGATQYVGSAADPYSMSFGGFTSRLDMNEATGQYTVSNLGFVNGPLRLAQKDALAMNLALQAFGFAFEERTEQLVFNSALNMMLNATLSDPDLGNAALRFNITGPAGTRLNTSNTSQSAATVLNGGPLQLDYSLSSSDGSENGLVTWDANGCQANSSVPVEESAILSLAGC